MKRLILILTAALFLGCTNPKPTPDKHPTRSTTPSEPFCIPEGNQELIVGNLIELGQGIGFCLYSDYGSQQIACTVADLKTGLYKKADPKKFPTPKGDKRITVKNNSTEICPTPETCKTVPLSEATSNLPSERYSLNHSATRMIAVIIEENETGDEFELYDVEGGTKMIRGQLGDGKDYNCCDVQWLHDTLCIHCNVCAGPGGISWISDPDTGAHLWELGGTRNINTYGEQAIYVSGDNWAILDAFGNQVIVQNIKSGEVIFGVNLEPFYEGGFMENSIDMIVDGNRQLVLVLGSPSTGDILVIKGESGHLVNHIKAPRCE